jgi:hypothetical protein
MGSINRSVDILIASKASVLRFYYRNKEWIEKFAEIFTEPALLPSFLNRDIDQ